MSHKISDTEFRESLDRRLSSLQPDPWMAQKTRARAQAKGEEPVKKRLSVGVIILIAVIAISMSVGIATVSGWDVIRFLYGYRTVQKIPEVDTFPVHMEVSSDGALLRVESAIYDGRKLAFDSYLENLKPDTPIESRLVKFTANDVDLLDIVVSGSVCNYWIPSIFFEQDFAQGGEIVDLPKELQDAETLHICMSYLVYRPIDPVFQSQELTPEEAAAKTEEGYLVITDPYDFIVYREEEEGWQWDIAGGVAEYPEKFKIETLDISFDVAKGDYGYHVLKPQPVYETAYGTAAYDVAAITTGGLQLTLRLHPAGGAFPEIAELVLTDGDGTPLQGDRFTPDVTAKVDTADPGAAVYRYRWPRIRQKDLPDTVSLTCILENGEQLVFPVQVR